MTKLPDLLTVRLSCDFYTKEGKPLTTDTINWQTQKTYGDGTINQTCYLPYVQTETKKTYDLTSGDLISTDTTTTSDIDKYADPKTIIQTTQDNTGTYTTKTENTYDQDTLHWLIGELTKTTVTMTNPDKTSLSRTSAFEYDFKTGMLTKEITEPEDANYTLTKEYTRDNFGNITITKVSGKDIATIYTRQIYDNEGRYIISQTDAAGQTTSQQMDPRYGTPLTVTDVNRLVTSYKYDEFGRPIEQTNPDGTITKTTYQWTGNTHSLKTLNSESLNPGVTNYQAIQQGIEPKTQAAKTNPKETTVGIGMQNQPIQAVYSITTEQEDKDGNQIGPIQTTYKDELDREIATSTQVFDGATIRLDWKDTFYDELGRESQQSVPYFADTNTNTILYTKIKYDDLGKVIEADNPGSTEEKPNKTKMEYNDLTTTTTNSIGQTTTKIANAKGKVIEAIDNAGTKTKYNYDPYGNMTEMEIEKANGAKITTKITYDKLGRKIAINDPDKGNWSYSYDQLGQLTSQTDAKGQKTTFKYDLDGRKIQRTDHAEDPSQAVTSTWEYGTKNTYTDNNRNIGQLIKEDGVSNAKGGKAGGKELIQAAKEGVISYSKTITYDELSRPTTEAATINGNKYTTTTEYDNASRPKTETYPNGLKVENKYNQLGDTIAIENGDNEAIKYWTLKAMDAQGNITSYTRSNGMTTTKTYDPATNFLTNIETTASPALKLQQAILPITKKTGAKNKNETDIQKLIYQYDLIGNVQTKTDNVNNKATSYQYDKLNRLTKWTENTETKRTYQYDETGNLTYKSNLGTYTYGEKSQSNYAGPHAVTSIKDTDNKIIASFTYDQNGDQTGANINGKARTINYSSYNKPLQIITKDPIAKEQNQVNFYYSADRTRFERQDQETDPAKNITTTTTLYLGNYELETKTNTQTIKEKCYIGPDTLYIHTINADDTTTDNTYELIKDNLGSTTAIADQTGAVVQRYQYTPFGEQEEMGEPGAKNKKTNEKINKKINKKTSLEPGSITHTGFTGQEEVEPVNLIHMNGRMYDPVIGRFLSADPTIQDPENSQSLNRYSYCDNNPIAYTDPTGYCKLSDVFKNKYVQLAIGITVAAIAMSNPELLGLAGHGWLAAALVSGAYSGVTTLANGGSLEDAVGGAAITFGAALIWKGTGDFLKGMSKGASKAAIYGEKVAVHGIVGGGIQAAEGESFQDGFLSAAASAAVPIDMIGGNKKELDTTTIIERTGAAAIVGGTVAAATGGNFENGAETSAFAELYNDTVLHTVESWAGKVGSWIDEAADYVSGRAQHIESNDWMHATNSDNPSMQQRAITSTKMSEAGALVVDMVSSTGGVSADLNLSEHALQRMTQRGISSADIKTTMQQGPFSYNHGGEVKTGYYNPESKIFVAQSGSGRITTVMKTGPNYIRNLKELTP